MASDLTRASYSGKESVLYYNAGTEAAPDWVEVPRARNITTENGRNLGQVDMHGSDYSPSIPGYGRFTGSFEYVRRRGDDTIWDAIVAARDAGTPIMLRHLDGKDDVIGTKGWEAPVIIGQISKSANGNDPVVSTVPFELAEAYDASDALVSLSAVEITV